MIELCQCPDRAASLFYLDQDVCWDEEYDCVNALIGLHPFSTVGF